MLSCVLKVFDILGFLFVVLFFLKRKTEGEKKSEQQNILISKDCNRGRKPISREGIVLESFVSLGCHLVFIWSIT